MKAQKLDCGSKAYPVFITSEKVTPQLVDTFLNEISRRCEELQHEDVFEELYIVTTATLPEKHKIDECFSDEQWPTPASTTTVPPVADFTPVPEFLNASVEELDGAFLIYFDICPFTRYSYIVLDARSVEDGTCLIRSVGPRGNPARARCLFKLATEILNGPETLMCYNINDGKVEEKCKDPKGEEQFYYDDKNWRW